MSEHQWYYLKAGFNEDDITGPMEEVAFLREVRAGKIGPKVKVMSPSRTKKGWLQLRQIPGVLKISQQGEDERTEQQRQQAEEKKRQRELEAQEKAELKRQQVELKQQRAVEKQVELEAQQKAERQRERELIIQQRNVDVATRPLVTGTLMAAPANSGVPATQTRVACPFCGESILSTAMKCRHCNEFFDGRRNGQPQPQSIVVMQAPAAPVSQNVNVVVQQVTQVVAIGNRWNPLVAMILSLLIPGLGQLYKGQLLNGFVWFVVVAIGYAALLIPGLVLHLCCIVGAGVGDPRR